MSIVKVGHADHGIERLTMEIALALLKPNDGFFAGTVVLPSAHPDVLCALYGPIMGDAPVPDDAVFMSRRSPDRPLSRLVPWSARLTREVTIIGMQSPHGTTIFTAYGGRVAPREPGDRSLVTDEEKAEAQAFWAEHALATKVDDEALLSPVPWGA